MTPRHALMIFACLLCATPTAGRAAGHGPRLPVRSVEVDSARLLSEAPTLDPQALALSLEARHCAGLDGEGADAERLAVIDYSRPSTEPRLWVFDLGRHRLLHHEHVAHGSGSGGNFATSFSNLPGSHQTSLGLFLTTDTYEGANGYSLRMDGLEPGFNDAARDRAIVIHGAPYVDPVAALRQGRLGRSFGCPALRPAIAREVIDSLRGGQLLFAYYPERRWLEHSRLLGCRTPATAASTNHVPMVAPATEAAPVAR